ncbi:hypothetical protein GCM10009069_21320 [Algimonas arctica]|uniref:Response regulatory domain-containing protein n=2 Tax=Algimonas arctica TaxID=1479486 RepID=A0A8J3CRE9_9PROT|nr:hypothetical protein GCM10009069_21320 [Algimonas arctica]
MDGQLKVTPNKDIGTTFTLQLPMKMIHSASTIAIAAGPVAQDANPRSHEGVVLLKSPEKTKNSLPKILSILIIDDNDEVSGSIVKHLNRPQINTFVSPNGTTTITTYNTVRFDFIFVNATLQAEEDNFAVQSIRDHEKAVGRTRTPIICVTRQDFIPDGKESLTLEIDDYLPTSTHKPALLQIIAKWIKNTQSDPRIEQTKIASLSKNISA